MGDFNTYWRMTINNYDDRDLALVRQGYPDDIRKLIYTLETGEEGTPHIQAYIQMKRSVRLSHMRKLFPGANFGSQTSAEWRLNQHNYAQKLDKTADSPAVILNGDPLHTVEGTVRRVVEVMISDYGEVEDLDIARRLVEQEMVVEDYTMAKVFSSAVYRTMWKNFGHEMYKCLFRKRVERMEAESKEANTHTHTHGQEKFSRRGGIKDGQDNEGSDNEESGSEEDDQGEGDEDGESGTDEGYSEGSGDQSDEEDDWEGD